MEKTRDIMQLKQLRQPLRGVPIIICRRDGRTAREKNGNGYGLALPHCLVERGMTLLSCCVDLCARVEERLYRCGVASNCGDLERGLTDSGA